MQCEALPGAGAWPGPWGCGHLLFTCSAMTGGKRTGSGNPGLLPLTMPSPGERPLTSLTRSVPSQECHTWGSRQSLSSRLHPKCRALGFFGNWCPLVALQLVLRPTWPCTWNTARWESLIFDSQLPLASPLYPHRSQQERGFPGSEPGV